MKRKFLDKNDIRNVSHLICVWMGITFLSSFAFYSRYGNAVAELKPNLEWILEAAPFIIFGIYIVACILMYSLKNKWATMSMWPVLIGIAFANGYFPQWMHEKHLVRVPIPNEIEVTFDRMQQLENEVGYKLRYNSDNEGKFLIIRNDVDASILSELLASKAPN